MLENNSDLNKQIEDDKEIYTDLVLECIKLGVPVANIHFEANILSGHIIQNPYLFYFYLKKMHQDYLKRSNELNELNNKDDNDEDYKDLPELISPKVNWYYKEDYGYRFHICTELDVKIIISKNILNIHIDNQILSGFIFDGSGTCGEKLEKYKL